MASYESGYVRRVDKNQYVWQLNKTRKVPRTWRNRIFQSTERILIPNELDRLRYLLDFCVKNYYIGHSNLIHNGEYIPKWKAAQANGKPCICRVTSEALQGNSNLRVVHKDHAAMEFHRLATDFVNYVNMRNNEY